MPYNNLSIDKNFEVHVLKLEMIPQTQRCLADTAFESVKATVKLSGLDYLIVRESPFSATIKLRKQFLQDYSEHTSTPATDLCSPPPPPDQHYDSGFFDCSQSSQNNKQLDDVRKELVQTILENSQKVKLLEDTLDEKTYTSLKMEEKLSLIEEERQDLTKECGIKNEQLQKKSKELNSMIANIEKLEKSHLNDSFNLKKKMEEKNLQIKALKEEIVSLDAIQTVAKEESDQETKDAEAITAIKKKALAEALAKIKSLEDFIKIQDIKITGMAAEADKRKLKEETERKKRKKADKKRLQKEKRRKVFEEREKKLKRAERKRFQKRKEKASKKIKEENDTIDVSDEIEQSNGQYLDECERYKNTDEHETETDQCDEHSEDDCEQVYTRDWLEVEQSNEHYKDEQSINEDELKFEQKENDCEQNKNEPKQRYEISEDVDKDIDSEDYAWWEENCCYTGGDGSDCDSDYSVTDDWHATARENYAKENS